MFIKMNPTLIIVSAALALLFTFIIYLIFASAYSLWPFQKAAAVRMLKEERARREMKGYRGNENSVTPTPSTGTVDVSLPPVATVIIFILFFGFFIVVAYFGIQSTMARYKLAEDAIDKGQGGVAAAALAPEIGEGIGTGISDIFGTNRPR
jgi:amino acid transporter